MAEPYIINLGIIGGAGGFIGQHHDTAIAMKSGLASDGRPILYRVVASALSSDPNKSLEAGRMRGISRPYRSYAEMLEGETGREDGIHAVSIRLPNRRQHDAVIAALEAGYHVIVDKPNAITPLQAVQQAELAAENDLVTAVTFTYSGSPCVREMRAQRASGAVGTINGVHAFYPQGWTLGLPESKVWRLTEEGSGIMGVTFDLGATHCLSDVRYVSGMELASITANLKRNAGTIIDGDLITTEDRQVENYGQVLFTLTNGQGNEVLGSGYWSQVAAGWGNTHELRLDGDERSLQWANTTINGSAESLIVRSKSAPAQIWSRDPNAQWFSPLAKRAMRSPGEHGEGFEHWLAAIYGDFIEQVAGRVYGVQADPLAGEIMTLQDGAISLWNAFKVAESHLRGGVPVDATYVPEQAGELEATVMGLLEDNGGRL